MRRLLVVAALLSAVALLWLLQRERTPPRAPPRRGLLEGESLVDMPDLPAAKLPERAPTFLTGHVYGPDGRPVDKAEVRVVYPKTFDLVRSGPEGTYELPFDRHGRFLVEAALTIEYAPERAWAEVPEYEVPAPLDFHLKPAGAIFGEVTLAGMPVDDAGVELFAIDVFGDEQSVHDTSARNGYFNFYFDPPKDVPLKLEVTSGEGLLRAPLRFTWRGEQMNVGRLDLVPYPGLRICMRLPDGSYSREVSTARREDLVSYGGTHFPKRFLGTRSRVFFPVDHDVTARLVFVGGDRPREGDPEDMPARTYMVEREVDMIVGRPRELEVIVRPGPLVVASRLVDRKGEGVRGRLRCGESEAWTGEKGAFEIVVPCGGLHTIFLDALEAPGVGWVELARDEPAHAILLDADAAKECELDLGGRILLLGGANFAFALLPGDGYGAALWSAGGEDEPRPVYLSPRLEPGSYRWAWDDGQGADRRGDVRIDPDRLTVLDVR